MHNRHDQIVDFG
ncbi:hypothetical protein D047_3385A, partial [Vibrio parahaemolyticus VPTS-2010_2]